MHLHTTPLAKLLATVYYVYLNGILPTRMQQQSDQEISKQHKTQTYYFSISPSNQLLTDFYQTSPYVWHSSHIPHPWRLALNGLNIFHGMSAEIQILSQHLTS